MAADAPISPQWTQGEADDHPDRMRAGVDDAGDPRPPLYSSGDDIVRTPALAARLNGG